MPDEARRQSVLAHIAQGRFGADCGIPGVVFSVRQPVSIVMAIARKGQSGLLPTALGGMADVSVQWAGADQYYVVADGRAEGHLFRELRNKFSGIAAVSDQSHARVIISVSGPMVRQVLAKGTPVDLHASEFAIGQSAITQMAHVTIHLTRVRNDTFELSVFRGFAESFWEWLTTQSEEFGYQVM